MPDIIQVIWNPDGRWAVRRYEGKRTLQIYIRQEDAISMARRIAARREGSRVEIIERDGSTSKVTWE